MTIISDTRGQHTTNNWRTKNIIPQEYVINFVYVIFRGVNVLHRKSELRKALDKRQEERKKKEMEEYLKSKKTGFEKKLEAQAEKLQAVSNIY